MIFSIVSLMLPGKLLDLALLASYLYFYLDSTDWCTQRHIDNIMDVFNVTSLLINPLYAYFFSSQAILHLNKSNFPQIKAFSNDCCVKSFIVVFCFFQ